MLVEMYEENGYWSFKTQDGINWTTPVTTNGVLPMEAKGSDKSKLKQVLKLKDAGFTADEILEIIKEI